MSSSSTQLWNDWLYWLALPRRQNAAVFAPDEVNAGNLATFFAHVHRLDADALWQGNASMDELDLIFLHPDVSLPSGDGVDVTAVLDRLWHMLGDHGLVVLGLRRGTVLPALLQAMLPAPVAGASSIADRPLARHLIHLMQRDPRFRDEVSLLAYPSAATPWTLATGKTLVRRLRDWRRPDRRNWLLRRLLALEPFIRLLAHCWPHRLVVFRKASDAAPSPADAGAQSAVTLLAVTVTAETGQTVDGMLQHAYNPRVSSSLSFYAYTGSRRSHIISGDRHLNGCTRLRKERAVMRDILRRLGQTPLATSILYGGDICETALGCFRVQRYCQPGIPFRIASVATGDARIAFDKMFDWLLQFQEASRSNKAIDAVAVQRHIAAACAGWLEAEPGDMALAGLIDRLLPKRLMLQAPMPLAAHHGDFCFWNMLLDPAGDVRVFDWEFAQREGWVVLDAFSHLLLIWMAWHEAGRVSDDASLLHAPANQDEHVLAALWRRIRRHYPISAAELHFYMAYTFLHIHLRPERRVKSNHWRAFLPAIHGVLERAGVAKAPAVAP